MSSLDEYIEQHTTPEPELFARITRDTNLHILNPHMLSGQVQGELLRMLSRMIRPQRILELGTFTGYSALCLAEGLAEGGELITIEHNDELEATIRRNLSQSPLGKQIQLIIGDAKQILSSNLSSVSASGLSAPAVCQAKPVYLTSYSSMPTNASTARITSWSFRWCGRADSSLLTTPCGTDILSILPTTATSRLSVCAPSTAWWRTIRVSARLSCRCVTD